MSDFKSNLQKARGSLVFLLGITLAFGTVFSLEKWQPAKASAVASTSKIEFVNSDSLPLRAHRSLSDSEKRMAEIAWNYFRNNTNEGTGLVNSVDGYTASTLWDTSSYLLALISANDLGIVDGDEYDSRLKKILGTLANLPLFEDRLPNKVYSTSSASMTTYSNQATDKGIGWSAIDIGRIMVPFNVLVWKNPEYTALVNQVLTRWDINAISDNTEMMGADVTESGETRYLQEGRLGYEEYAAKSLALSGIDLSEALSYERHFEYVTVDGIEVGTDLRTPDVFDAINFVVSEPYVLDGLEFGWDRYSRSLAYGVYRAQEQRYKRTGTLTAVSEDNIDEAPYFVYNSVFADGKIWHTVTETGEDATQFRTLSSKAAIGWYALYDTPYTEKLFQKIQNNFHEDKGWYAGIYEETGLQNKAITANSNAIILESLRYIELGPMLMIGRAS